MGYRHRQTQADCNRCGEPTLHTQVLYEVPNGVYLIILIVLGVLGTFLFWPVLGLALLWLGIWFVHVLANALHNLINADAAYRCGRCGQRKGTLTPEQRAAKQGQKEEWQQKREDSRAERLEHERQRRIDHAVAQRAEKLQRVREREAQRPHLEEIRRATARRQREVLAAIWEACCGLPGCIDDGLKTLAGEGNAVIHGFLRFVTVSLLATNLALLTWLVYWWF
jgi:hypothetical protein